MPTFIEQWKAAGEESSVQVPKTAGLLAVAGALEAEGEFAAKKGEPRTKPKRDANGHYSFPVKLLARSPDPINHRYWGKVVHNLAGVQTSGPQVQLDWLHDVDAVFGAGKTEVTAEGLWVKGDVASFRDGDYGDQVWNLLYGPVPMPLEASIQFDLEQGLKWSYLEPNQVATVNGKKVEGECMVIDQWLLRRVAICPTGYDPGTKTQGLSKDGSDELISFSLPRQAETVAPPSPSSLSTEETMPAEQTPAQLAAAATPAPTVPAAAPAAGQLSIETLKRFTDRFGFENGSKWALEGLSYEAALDRQLLALEAASKANADALAQKEQTIATMQLGHTNPATHQASDAPPPAAKPVIANDGVGTFAASLEGQFATLLGKTAQ